MNIRHGLRSSLLLAALCLAASAQAVVLRGSFEGTLQNVLLGDFPDPNLYDGAAFIGTFSFDTEAVAPEEGYEDTGLGIVLAIASTTVALPWPTIFDFDGSFRVSNTADNQVITLAAGGGHQVLGISLAGAPGAFTPDGLLASVVPAPIDASRSSLVVGTGVFGWSATGQLTGARFEPVTAPIPEPATWALLLGGLAALWRRLRPSAGSSAVGTSAPA